MNPRSPFPHPATRHEARQNALYWATEAERLIQAGNVMALGQAAATKASMWADIARSFPEEEMVVTVADDAWTPPPSARELIDGPLQTLPGSLELVPLNDPTKRVPSHVYDVLRALAVRYMDTTASGTASVIDDEIGRLEGIRLVMSDRGNGCTMITLES